MEEKGRVDSRRMEACTALERKEERHKNHKQVHKHVNKPKQAYKHSEVNMQVGRLRNKETKRQTKSE